MCFVKYKGEARSILKFLTGKPKGMGPLERARRGGRTILEWILKK